MYISDEYSSIAIREAIGRLFLDPDFAGRLCFILGSSSNGDVLDSLSRHEDDICCSICFGSNLDFFQFRFLLSLLEAGFERLELGAEFEGSGYAGAAFMCACAEAMRESGVRSPAFFRLTEIVGVLCSNENLADCPSGLCDLVGHRLAI